MARGSTSKEKAHDPRAIAPGNNNDSPASKPGASQHLTRSSKLRDLLEKVLAGSQPITLGNARLFLEAICDQSDPQGSILRLIASEHGFPALQASLQIEPSIGFLNGPVTVFLQYLQAPAIKNICAGDVLRQIISKLVDPPLIWNAFLNIVRQENVTEDGLDAFSWLLLQLLSLPTERARPFAAVAGESQIQKVLLGSPRVDVRSRTHRLIHIAETIKSSGRVEVDGPGGRHDNDFPDIRKIRILPTPDELTSKDPFLRRAVDLNDVPKYDLALHLDNQFRLLREDLIRELREEISATLSPKRHGRRSLVIDNVSLSGVLCDGQQTWALQLRCTKDLPHFPSSENHSRLEFLEENPKFLKHQSVVCLLAEHEIVGLATIVRDEKLLAQCPPIICLKLTETAMETTLPRLRAAKINRLIQLSTAVFSYEPVLQQLKEVKEIALEDEILHWNKELDVPRPSSGLPKKLQSLVKELEKDYTIDLKEGLDYPRNIRLDKSQADCFLAGLQKRLTLIQGPPGTGKSFIGSLIAKAMHKFTRHTTLVVCQTHHALDQFLEDLLDSGIPAYDVVRLGATIKATPKTAPLSIQRIQSNESPKSDHFQRLKRLKCVLKEEGQKLSAAFESFREAIVTKSDIMEYLEFLMDGPPFAEAFRMPDESIRNMRLGRRGKTMNEFYLLDRWYRGKDAGIYKREAETYYWDVWSMRSQNRLDAYDTWKADILMDRVTAMRETGLTYNSLLEQVDAIAIEKDQRIIQQKRIIGCTTTAAAKYVHLIQSVSPDVLLVEEAGEILESHILTALGPETKQMVLIGDHKQLRPKVHWDLSVENGDGYDLNRSLFERLVLKGYPHHVLSQQHRMRPEISALARQLTYPDLVDAPKTQGRPDLRGFQDNLIFVNHSEEELEPSENQPSAGFASRQNQFEASMALKCVRYLGQQGYRTDNIVILTPYLGQLGLLLDELSKENDAILNDLDSHDLVRAGLMPAATADVNKPPIKIATIDNYQGEESDIVVVSLTRSNTRQEIGFMSSPERLNVMLSRARNALIMIGNAETFLGSRRGQEIWERFIELLKAGNHVYDGFPVKCERHSTRQAILKRPEEFDAHCPDGGCTEPCGVLLRCGSHTCPQRCHNDMDHSMMNCDFVIQSSCPAGHEQSSKCHENIDGTCRYCVQQDSTLQQTMQRQIQRQFKVDSEKAKHEAAIAELDQEIQSMKDKIADQRAGEERVRALQRKQRELEKARLWAKLTPDSRKSSRSDISSTSHRGSAPDTPSSLDQSETGWQETDQVADQALIENARCAAQKQWENQKQNGQKYNDALDALMSLTGLEDVKLKILYIKERIDKLLAKGLDMKHENLGLIMIGNPGTGKQTVARLYAKYLESIHVLPGKRLHSVTWSWLMREGASGVRKQLDMVVKSGGGALLIDDAFALVHEDYFNATAVLDFLITQIKTLAGKVIFILAGCETDIKKLLKLRPALERCLPHRLQFIDHTHQEILALLAPLAQRKFHSCGMRLQGGIHGRYVQIAIRRLLRDRGREGFENAAAVQHLWSKILERQAVRVSRENAMDLDSDACLLNKEDLIGPEPRWAVSDSAAWKELHSATGRQSVKKSMTAWVDKLQYSYEQELKGGSAEAIIMNRVLQGSSTTGMLSVGKQYGAFLADLGLFSNSKVVLKAVTDLVGQTTGESVQNMRALLRSSRGQVLLINNAQKLCLDGERADAIAKEHRTAMVEILIADLKRIPRHDQCVMLLGANNNMHRLLNSHDGFSEVFPEESVIMFEELDDCELLTLLESQLMRNRVTATDDAKHVAIQILGHARGSPTFGSTNSVFKFVAQARLRGRQREGARNSAERDPALTLLPVDFGPTLPTSVLNAPKAQLSLKDRKPKPAPIKANPKPINKRAPEPKNFKIELDVEPTKAASSSKLFPNLIGCDGVARKLEGYRLLAKTMRSQGLDPKAQIPFYFVFKGSPGTGKATVARSVAPLFHEMCLLPTKDIVELAASDLLDEVPRRTTVIVNNAIQQSAGKVLLIKGTHKLGDSELGAEALEAMTTTLQNATFSKRAVVILCGPTEAMNRMLSQYGYLSRCFSEEVLFNALTGEECSDLLQRQIKASGIGLQNKKGLSTSSKIPEKLKQLAQLPSWGNGRDIKAIAQSIIKGTFGGAESLASQLVVSETDILSALDDWHLEKERVNAPRNRNQAKEASARPGQSENSWVSVEVHVEDIDVDATADPSMLIQPDGPIPAPAAQPESTHTHTPSKHSESSLTEQKRQISDQQQVKPYRAAKNVNSANADQQEHRDADIISDDVEALIHDLKGMNLS